MSLSIIILTIYVLVIIVYSVFIVQQAINYRLKFGYLCEASGLGALKNEKHKYYNLGYFLFGFLSLFFSYNLVKSLNSGLLTTISSYGLYIADISLCLIALFPRDTKSFGHIVSSIVMFIATILSLLFLIYPFYITEFIPDIFIIYNVVIVIFLCLYLALKIRLILKFGYHNNLEKYVSIWEWIPFMLTILWSLILAVILIIN